MTTSPLPEVIDALVALGRTLTSIDELDISDGRVVTSGPGRFLMIGVDDPDAIQQRSAGERQSWAHAGNIDRDGRGEILCAVRYWIGDSGTGRPDEYNATKKARDGAYAIVSAFGAALRADPTIGVPDLFEAGFAGDDLRQGQDGRGAVATVIFRIAFTFRI